MAEAVVENSPAEEVALKIDEVPAITESKSEATMFVESSVLIENAKRHMLETSVRSPGGELMPLSTPPVGLGHLGVGVQLYFDFIFQMGILFFVLQLVTLPNLVAFLMGSMVEDNNPVNSWSGQMSVANYGNCPAAGCISTDQLEERCAWGRMSPGPDCYPARKLALYLGILDAAAMVLLVTFSLWFSMRWIPRTAEETDRRECTPADYTIMLKACPRLLGDPNLPREERRKGAAHAEYEKKVKEHFTSVLANLRKNPIDDPGAVAEVNLAREYEGKISEFMTYGEHLQEMRACEVHRERARQKDNKKLEKKHDKTFMSYDKKVKKVRELLKQQAALKDEHRDVVLVFVTFQKEEYKEAVLNEYRYAQYSLFRLCQPTRLRLEGRHRLHCLPACEPSDLYWENLDYNHTKRRLRKIAVTFATFLVLIICSLMIVSLKSVGAAGSSMPPERTTWLIKGNVLEPTSATGNVAECFKICRPEFYSSGTCQPEGGSSATWSAERWFDPKNDTLRNDTLMNGQTFNEYFGQTCAQGLLSPACDGETDPDKNWIGFEFTQARTILCSRVTQGRVNADEGVVASLRFYACKTPPLADSEAMANWGPADCEEMEAVSPWGSVDANGMAPSGSLAMTLDVSCNLDPPEGSELSIAAATAAKNDADKTGVENGFMQNPTYTCYCQQQAAAQGPGFLTPNYDTPSKQLCQAWSTQTSLTYGRMVGTILAVLVLNNVLLAIYTVFISWERLMTLSQVTKSQLQKLFAAQFINTGLLALLVNARIESVPDVLSFIKVLSIGEGNYYDLNSEWFTAVGSSVLITIFMQVFSTTIPPLVISYLVTPIMICFMSRGKVTQETMNLAYRLPDWNLALRLAQSMNVIFCVVMYSGGMPIMYTVGWIYCLVAYWLDKVALLRGSAKPPTYSQDVLVICMNMMPFAAFLHVMLSAWSLGNQMLFPSDWETFGSTALVGLGEGLFNITRARSEEVVAAYRVSSPSERKDLYWEFISARMLDMSRSGTAILMVAFLVFCAFYIVSCLYTMGLKPIVDPFLFLVEETLSCLSIFKPKKAEYEQKDFSDAVKEWKGVFSYRMDANENYKGAYDAIRHAATEAERALLEAEAEAGAAVTAEAVKEEAAGAGAGATLEGMLTTPINSAGMAEAVTEAPPSQISQV